MCPPGTFVKRHCTAQQRTECAPCPANHYADQWNDERECEYCSTVCKELQHVTQECNGTRPRECECAAGYFLEVEFCLPHTKCPPGYGVKQQGTPERDTVCAECPTGMYSDVSSSTAPCQKQTSCRKHRVSHEGSSTEDTKCMEENRSCKIDITLCEEALFRSRQASDSWSDVLLHRLPPTDLTSQQIESIRNNYEPKDQLFYLFKLYRNQSKGDNFSKQLRKDLKICEKGMLKEIGHIGLTVKHLTALMQSLPGRPLEKSDIENTMKNCPKRRQILKLLSLWREQNGGNTIEGLQRLTSNKLPKKLQKVMKRLDSFLSSVAMYRLYDKIILGITSTKTQLVKTDSLL
ncbi:tumor necrosis factor receptor superfamily member 11B isoform X2 [Hyperolius riggenbachi]